MSGRVWIPFNGLMTVILLSRLFYILVITWVALIGMKRDRGKVLKKRKKELAPSREVCCEYCELGVDSRGGGGKYVKRDGRGKRGNNGRGGYL